ncbi:hypothetical protein ACOMHN_040836 [Nucella lapillus]
MDVEVNKEVHAKRRHSLDKHALRRDLALDSQLEESVARVMVLYTGGTIGMVVAQANGGYTPKPNSMVPKLRSLPLFHDDETAKKMMTAEEYERFLVLP